MLPKILCCPYVLCATGVDYFIYSFRCVVHRDQMSGRTQIPTDRRARSLPRPFLPAAHTTATALHSICPRLTIHLGREPVTSDLARIPSISHNGGHVELDQAGRSTRPCSYARPSCPRSGTPVGRDSCPSPDVGYKRFHLDSGARSDCSDTPSNRCCHQAPHRSRRRPGSARATWIAQRAVCQDWPLSQVRHLDCER